MWGISYVPFLITTFWQRPFSRRSLNEQDKKINYYVWLPDTLLFNLCTFQLAFIISQQKFLHHRLFAICKSNPVIISESRNPGLPVLLPLLPTIFMEHRKKMESFGQWTGHSHNIFCFHTQLKSPRYAYWDPLEDIIRDDDCAYAVFQYNIHCTGSSRITL